MAGGKPPSTGREQLPPICLHLLLGSLTHKEEKKGKGGASPVIKWIMA